MRNRLTPFVRRDWMTPTFDEFFRDFWNRPTEWPQLEGELLTSERARMDVVDKGTAFEVMVDLPGVKKEDIVISVEGSKVTIRAEMKAEKEEREGERVIYTERSATSYARNFELPAAVTEDGADAKFDNGVLTLTLPKREPVVARRLTVH